MKAFLIEKEFCSIMIQNGNDSYLFSGHIVHTILLTSCYEQLSLLQIRSSSVFIILVLLENALIRSFQRTYPQML